MQAVELEVDITADGRIHICLPPSYRAWFGRRAKVIILLPDVETETLAEIDKDIAQMSNELDK